MLYLSQLILNPRSRQVHSELANPYEMHRTLMRAFPEAAGGGPGRVLFRVERSGPANGTGITVLVQSDKSPHWDSLAKSGNYLLAAAEENPATKTFTPTFITGQRLVFRLRANPTIKRFFEGKTGSKRVGLYKEEDQKCWLERKAEQGGFRILAMNVISEGMNQGRIKHPGEKVHKLSLLAVRFDGLLEVVEPQKFTDTLQQGIGRGKGLGFGLLSVARA